MSSHDDRLHEARFEQSRQVIAAMAVKFREQIEHEHALKVARAARTAELVSGAGNSPLSRSSRPQS